MKPCISCGEPSIESRCDEHKIERKPQPWTIRDTNRWQRLSRRLRRMQPWCSSCGAEDGLSVDHIVPLAHGGDPFDVTNLQILCQSCNSTKATKRATTRGDTPTPASPPWLG